MVKLNLLVPQRNSSKLTIAALNSPLLWVALAMMWLQGGIASILPIGYQTGINLLILAGIKSSLIPYIIWSGACLDIVMAIGAILPIIIGGITKLYNLYNIYNLYYMKIYALTSVILIIIYTLLGSILAPQLWFDAFGCLAKNIPIIVINWLIYKNNK